MHKLELTTLQLLTILATLDSVRSDYFEKAAQADSKGQEASATSHYDTAEKYETLILALKKQMGNPQHD
jgi:hypothetical protein